MTTINILLIITSSLLAASLFTTLFFINKNKLMKKELIKSKDINKKSTKKINDFLKFKIGDRGILDYTLRKSPENKSFDLTYEVEIMGVSNNRVKVKVLGFNSFDSIANDSSNKSSIIKFIDGKWIPSNKINLIASDRDLRDEKLKELLS